jgi:hypothetical protein
VYALTKPAPAADVSEPGHERGRMLIDDDPALGGYLGRVLWSRGGFSVTHEPTRRILARHGGTPASIVPVGVGYLALTRTHCYLGKRTERDQKTTSGR